MTSRPILFRLLNNNILFVIIGASWLISQVSAEVTYILSDTNVLTCPAGSVPVDSPEECEVAATAVSIAWGGSWPDIINPNLSSAACVNDLNYNDFSWFRAETDYNYRPGYKLVCKIAVTNSGGDPHFIGFSDRTITYQGECTLILLESPSATASGDDVTVHVRTTRKLDFSYISGVAMKIGDDVIEITPKADLILNGEVITMGDNNNGSLTMSGLPFVMTKEVKGTKSLIVAYSFDLGNGRIINVQANKKRSMMFVKTKGQFPIQTVGMLGTPGKKDMVSRDGKILMSDIDVNAYGESWQVKDTDDQLFQEALGPQYPQKCLYEDAPGATAAQLRGRRKLLVKKIVSLEEAKSACESVTASKRELCIQDAIAMGDLEIKDDPFYLD